MKISLLQLKMTLVNVSKRSATLFNLSLAFISNLLLLRECIVFRFCENRLVVLQLKLSRFFKIMLVFLPSLLLTCVGKVEFKLYCEVVNTKHDITLRICSIK